MKKSCIIFLMSFIIILTVVCLPVLSIGGENAHFRAGDEYFRIHVRANSNSEEDQAVKYAARDLAVEILTPIVSKASDIQTAMGLVEDGLDELVVRIDGLLKEHNFFYSSTAKITREYFPTRVYKNCTLNAGEYPALILSLGEGRGENWWCVVYPPLCFSAKSGEIVYKSKLVELFHKIKNPWGR